MGAVEENVAGFGSDTHDLIDGGCCGYDGGATDDAGAGIPVEEGAARGDGHRVGAPQVNGPFAEGKGNGAGRGAPTEVPAPNACAPARLENDGDVAGGVVVADGDGTARSGGGGSGGDARVDLKAVGVDDADSKSRCRRGRRAKQNVAADGRAYGDDFYEGAVGEAVRRDGDDDLGGACRRGQDVGGSDGRDDRRDVVEGREFAGEEALMGADDGGGLAQLVADGG